MKEKSYSKRQLQEEMRKRGSLTISERMLKVEILLENHLTHHSKITRYLLFPILVGVSVSTIMSIITLVVKFKAGLL